MTDFEAIKAEMKMDEMTKEDMQALVHTAVSTSYVMDEDEWQILFANDSSIVGLYCETDHNPRFPLEVVLVPRAHRALVDELTKKAAIALDEETGSTHEILEALSYSLWELLVPTW